MTGLLCYLWWFLAGMLLGWLLHWLLGRGIQKRITHETTTSGPNSPDYQLGFAAGQASAKQSYAAQTAVVSGAAIMAGAKAVNDDLQKIEGIGPKINELLIAGGIDTFEKLAEAPVTRVQEILEAAGPRFRLANPASWAAQARLCAEGRWEALKQLQDELTAGVDKSSVSNDSNH